MEAHTSDVAGHYHSEDIAGNIVKHLVDAGIGPVGGELVATPLQAADGAGHNDSAIDRHQGQMCISTVTVGELIFEAERSAHPERNLADIDRLTARLEVLPFDAAPATHFGQLCAAWQINIPRLLARIATTVSCRVCRYCEGVDVLRIR